MDLKKYKVGNVQQVETKTNEVADTFKTPKLGVVYLMANLWIQVLLSVSNFTPCVYNVGFLLK